jgi:hypothetical protein
MVGRFGMYVSLNFGDLDESNLMLRLRSAHGGLLASVVGYIAEPALVLAAEFIVGLRQRLRGAAAILRPAIQGCT